MWLEILTLIGQCVTTDHDSLWDSVLLNVAREYDARYGSV